jgi:hypothetical protein
VNSGKEIDLMRLTQILKENAKAADDPLISDVDSDLDREVSYAAKITMRVMYELMKRHKTLFPGRREPIFDGVHEEDLAE